MQEERLFKLQKEVMDLCVLVHTELSSMVRPTQQDDTEDSFISLDEVLGLDVHEAMQHISAAVKDLLGLKRDVKQRREYDDYQTDDKYQKALQKLENEVRNHIKVRTRQIEQQLKLLYESTQTKLEDCEKAKTELAASHKAALEQLKKESKRTDNTKRRADQEPLISTRELSAERQERSKLSAELRTLKRTTLQDASRISDLERKIKKLETDRSHRQQVVHSRRVSMENAAEGANTSKINDLYKRKYEEKCHEVMLLQRRNTQLLSQPAVHKDTSSKSPLKQAADDSGSKSSRRLSNPQAAMIRKERVRPMSSTTLRQYVMNKAV
jgi:hypothetical protein